MKPEALLDIPCRARKSERVRGGGRASQTPPPTRGHLSVATHFLSFGPLPTWIPLRPPSHNAEIFGYSGYSLPFQVFPFSSLPSANKPSATKAPPSLTKSPLELIAGFRFLLLGPGCQGCQCHLLSSGRNSIFKPPES